MDILEALTTRKSVRGFKPDPVPREILREVLRVSGRAPSAVNSQPWEFFVLAGDVIDNIKRGNIEKARSGAAPNPELRIGRVVSEPIQHGHDQPKVAGDDRVAAGKREVRELNQLADLGATTQVSLSPDLQNLPSCVVVLQEGVPLLRNRRSWMEERVR